MKITRKEKIDFLTGFYKEVIKQNSKYDLCLIENQIIIDSVGISGLKEVKKREWL